MKPATFVLVFVVMAVTNVGGHPPSPDYQPAFNESRFGRIYTDVIEQDEVFPEAVDRGLLAVFYYKVPMVQNNRKDNNACWHCSSPCRGTICCSGPYPQCCMVNRVCGCCRR